jgi:hypothetical protein
MSPVGRAGTTRQIAEFKPISILSLFHALLQLKQFGEG